MSNKICLDGSIESNASCWFEDTTRTLNFKGLNLLNFKITPKTLYKKLLQCNNSNILRKKKDVSCIHFFESNNISKITFISCNFGTLKISSIAAQIFELLFEDCVFVDTLNCEEHSNFKHKLTIKNVTTAKFNFSKANFDEEISINGISSKSTFKFLNIISLSSINISSIEKSDMIFENSSIKEIKISNSKDISINISSIEESDMIFENSSIKEIKISNSKNISNLKVNFCDINSFSATNCNFTGNVLVYNKKHKGKFEFLKCNFKDFVNIKFFNSDILIKFISCYFQDNSSQLKIESGYSTVENEIISRITKYKNSISTTFDDIDNSTRDSINKLLKKFIEDTDSIKRVLSNAIEYVKKDKTEQSNILKEHQGNIEIILSYSTFDNKVRIKNCSQINYLRCNNTTFNNLIDFYNSTFINKTSFLQTDFLSKTIFSKATFLENVEFRYNKVNSDSYINFSKSTFKQGINIAESNFVNNLNFWGINYNFYSPVEEEEIKEIQESLRIIKNSFRQKNDSIHALEFEKHEIDVYRTKKLNKKEKFQLLLNDISNKHRTSWVQGIIFTISISVLFYWLCCILVFYSRPILPFHWDIYFTEYFSFLNVTRWREFHILTTKAEGLILIPIFIGRIFISYGYYQTIQAFRKYSKV